jgi:hypothetical protein
MVGNTTPKWVELVLGASGTYLRSDASDAAWATILDADLPATIARDSELHAEAHILGTSGPHTGDLPLADGGTGASLVDPNDDRVMFWDDSAGAVVFCDLGTGLTSDATPTIKIDTSVLYSVHQYIFTPDAAPGDAIVAGDQQGNIYVSGPSNETVKRIVSHCETAPVTSAATWQIEFGNTEDLDTVDSWTEIDLFSHTAAAKTIVSTSFTNATITAQRIIRFNVDAIGGTAAKDVTVSMEVWRPLQT